MTTTAAPENPPAQTDGRGNGHGWGSTKLFALTLLILGAVGEFFSFLITIDKIKLAENPNFVPACTVSEIVSCTNVMRSPQAEAFGFPNPLIGMVGFAVVMTTAVMLLIGVKLPRWYWWCTAIGLTAGVVFVHWMAYNAIFNINALCPYCMVVWAVMLALFVMVVVHMAREHRRATGERVPHSPFGMPLLVLIVWYLGFIAVIWMQFWM